MWTSYRHDFRNGVWSLLREDEHRNQELFHRQLGWQRSEALSERRAAGAVDHDDVISEEQAQTLIRELQAVDSR